MAGNIEVVGEAGPSGLDQASFRRVLGRFCTGVTVVAGMDGERPVGFTCQSFAALSLEPPLVLFCPGRTSRTWPLLAESGRFCVNVLADRQEAVSTAFGRGGVDKFAEVGWHPGPSGSPVLDDVLAWADCTVEAVHEAGDHYVVIGRVQALGEGGARNPLLFYRGAYAGVRAEAGPLDALLAWPGQDDWL
ncbi:flavin reductase family protein [Saccharopolyspora sp. NFXS83]|uniref:3-hydroxy-9,10-secoandrosta-1,3,5(10)-triene-9, 17-dione monooxygenase reductase subunit n=1 Tax=Saccharopolyspora sp. NFXS83 TaxID=2993560 RepID=UPI00224B18D3|nr:3-hydroxy-9,10-secoandrosta-1,3,5(10)-triene-9,17-dione monooxygenase reductase subunit [Saccharopolyspora sp. NFXS83]MCX2730439.1 flavin reductase family protein [Saccharopolyspora sp. NFXS83]